MPQLDDVSQRIEASVVEYLAALDKAIAKAVEFAAEVDKAAGAVDGLQHARDSVNPEVFSTAMDQAGSAAQEAARQMGETVPRRKLPTSMTA